MMKWGRNKHVSSSSSKLSHALPASWFSKLSVSSSNLKPTKEKKQDDVVSHNMYVRSSTSSTKCRNDIHESKKSFQRVSKSEDMESNEKFEEIMSSVKKKVRDFQRESRGFLKAMDRDNGTVILTPRIQVNRDKQRCQRRDQKLLEEKPKRLEQGVEVKVKKPARRTGVGRCGREGSLMPSHSEKNPANEWQKLKEMKHREVKLKADHQRKSLYIKREVNKLGTRENSKLKVFSPRSFEKCRVKAIEDLKNAKLREREHELVIATDVGRMESESFAVVKCSSDPQKDFRDSMIEMIIENGINHPKDLKELLVCYLNLNAQEYHDMIIKVFQQVHNDLNYKIHE